MNYLVELEKLPRKQLKKIDKSEKTKILKKLIQLEKENPARHLEKGLPFFVVEVGQYRICFELTEKKKKVYFIGNHKEYEKWYSKLF
jgi:mRNA-degrading endonuclease RelE of RelBE toxin-antitoxin system